MTTIPDEQTYPDIISLCLDKETPIKTIGKLLAYLDREVTGYPYEEYDENGDNPEECFSDASIDGYMFEYGGELAYPSLRIFLKRDKPEKLEDEWRQWMFRFGLYDLKIRCAWAYRNCLEGTGKYHPDWDGIVRGKCPRLSWSFDGLRGLYGIDMENWEDYKKTYEWISYVFKNYRNPPETDYYAFTGSLGHN